MNPAHDAACRDKLMFHSHCRVHDLPVPRLYAVLSWYGSRTCGQVPESLVEPAALRRFERHVLPDNVIAKPRTGNKGYGVQLLSRGGVNDQQQRLPGSRFVGVVDNLAADSDGFLVEEALRAHPAIEEMTGRQVVSSVRIVTFVENGISEVIAAYFRVVVGSSVTDNISGSYGFGKSANILAAVDIATGVVTQAFRLRRNGIGMEWIDCHPDTGRTIVDFRIPVWEAAVDLVNRAAMIFLPIVTVGWDVAITPIGPVLIEANEQYQYSGVGASAIRVREKLERHAGEHVSSRVEVG